jgi:hypothetical protein
MFRFQGKPSAGKVELAFTTEEKTSTAELASEAAIALAKDVALQTTLVGEDVAVVFQLNARDWIQLDKVTAVQVARALTQLALRADELAQAERIALDSAVLLRAGSNFALSSDPKIIDAARSEAAWNGALRRFMPGGVKSEEAFGTPTVVLHPQPKGKQ